MKMSNQKSTVNILILSLIQDLRCLDEIVDNSLNDVGLMGIDSWLYPHKKCSDTKHEQNISYEYQDLSYVNCLELLIDRLYIIINLVNNRMDIVRNRGNIYHPKRGTLGRSVQQFWEMFNIVEHEPKRTECKNPSETRLVINQGMQTELTTSESCNSCTQTNFFMKDITEYIAINFDKSLTKSHRDSINKNIFNMTKFGTIMKLTNCVKEDYHNLSMELKQSKYEIRSLAKTNSDLKSDIARKEEMIEQLTAAKHQCHEELAANLVELISTESYNIILEKEKSDLLRSNNNYEFITSDLGNQVKRLQVIQQNTQKFNEFSIERYEKDLHAQKCKIISLESDFNKLKLKYENLYGKNSKMCQMNFKLEQNLESILCDMGHVNNITDSINNFAIKTTERITQLNEKIISLQKDFHEQTNYIDNICNMCNVSIDKFKKAENGKYATENITSEIHGNPILDLTKQIEENDIVIKKLESQNQKFRIIIQAYHNKT